MNLSFAGCGFHGMYHFGVASCLQRHGKGIMNKVTCYGGASAGSLVAALLATSTPLQHGMEFTSELASKVRKYFLGALNPAFDLMQHLDEGLKRYLPQDAHKHASGKLYVSVTRFPNFKNSIMSHFDSRDDLIQVNQYNNPQFIAMYIFRICFTITGNLFGTVFKANGIMSLICMDPKVTKEKFSYLEKKSLYISKRSNCKRIDNLTAIKEEANNSPLVSIVNSLTSLYFPISFFVNFPESIL